MSVEHVFRKVQRALDTAGVPYMITGSYASSVHGEPRASKDIDIVIAPTRDQLVRLMSLFPPDEYGAEEEAALEAMTYNSMFNVIDYETGWRIDFIFRKNRPFSIQEFTRRHVVELSGRRLFVASPEDVVIAKLEWAKVANRSGRSKMPQVSCGYRVNTSIVNTSRIGCVHSNSDHSGMQQSRGRSNFSRQLTSGLPSARR